MLTYLYATDESCKDLDKVNSKTPLKSIEEYHNYDK